MVENAVQNKVLATGVSKSVQAAIGVKNMPKKGFNPKKMAAEIIVKQLFKIPGVEKVFDLIFPAPVGPFLKQNIFLLYQAIAICLAPAAIPVALPPFLVQVGIAIAVYEIQMHLDDIKKGISRTGKDIVKGFNTAMKYSPDKLIRRHKEQIKKVANVAAAKAEKAAKDVANKAANEAREAANKAANEAQRAARRAARKAAGVANKVGNFFKGF